MKTYNQFINEGVKNLKVRDLMTPKSDEDIKKSLEGLSPNEKLLLGAKEGLFWLVKQSLEEGADINYSSRQYLNIQANALKLAVEYGYDDIVEFLLNKEITIQPHLIDKACRNGDYNIIKLLIDAGEKPSFHDLILGIETNNVDIVKIILDTKETNPDINFDGNGYKWAMRVAEQGTPNYEIMDLLRPYGKTNESVRDLMKPKSEDEIIKGLEKLSPHQQLSNIKKYKLEHLISKDYFNKLIILVLKDRPIYIFRDLNYDYDSLIKIVSDEEIKIGLNRYASYLFTIMIYNKETTREKFNEIIYYLYVNGFNYHHMIFNNDTSQNQNIFFIHKSRKPLSTPDIGISGYSTLEDVKLNVQKILKNK